MRFGILGDTRVWRADGSEVPLGGPGRRALLALLLVRPGEPVTVESLVEDLYRSLPPDAAVHALQSQVTRLRQLLTRADSTGRAAIERGGAGYRLAIDPYDVDAHHFERLVNEGRRALDGGNAELAATVLRRALALWRGPAYADVVDARSVPASALRLEERRLTAVEDRIEADLRQGASRALVPELREMISASPLRERLHGLLMRALRADGRTAEALVAFDAARRLLADELGADPSPDLVAIHRGLLHGEPPQRVTGPPAQVSSFVGRGEDLAEVARLVRAARLVTLVGPGGVGKTRLSIEVTRDRGDVCFVELASVRQRAELPFAMLGALGLRDGGLHPGPSGSSPVARLTAALADREWLLVLDNCEHLIEPVAELVARLLSDCALLRVLATSREPLGVTGEHLWPVGSLPSFHAAQLFVDRASATRPNLALGQTDAPTVEHICAVLDGLPLAIELAAARLRTHDLAALAGGLGDRLGLLSRGSRTATPRHQTLRAAVAWSWDLLNPAEQTAARRMSVFASGADVEAARTVCAGPGGDEVLDSLVDKSLLERSGGRYRMLETIRAYCAEQLNTAGRGNTEADAVRRSHADYYLGLVRAADGWLRSSAQLRWLEILDLEWPNLQAALRWAGYGRHTALGLRLLAASSVYLWMRGLRASVTASAVMLLDQLPDGPPAGLEAEYVLCALAASADDTGREAWRRHRPAAEAILAAGSYPRHPFLLFAWASVNGADGDPGVAAALIAAGQAADDPWEAAMAHLLAAYPRLVDGDYAAAERAYATAVDRFGSLGDRWGMAMALGSQAGLASLRGDTAKGIALIDRAVTLTEQLGATEDLCDLLCDRGDYRSRDGIAVTVDELAAARTDYERAALMARQAGLPTYLAAALRGLGDIARLEGRPAEARRHYEEALTRFDPHWIRSVPSWVGTYVGLGRLAESDGDRTEARRTYLRAVEVAVVVGRLPDCATAVEALAGIELGEGAAAVAATLLGAAATLRGTGGPGATGGTAEAAAAALDRAAYEEAYRRGAELTHVEALRVIGLSDSVMERSPLTAR